MKYYCEKLMKITKKYMEELNVDRNDSDIIPLIREFILENCKNKRTAVWGVDRISKKLFENFPMELKNVLCVIDLTKELENSEFMGYPVISLEEIDKYKLECVILASYGIITKLTTEKMKNFAPNVKCINIYEHFKKTNVDLITHFYDRGGKYIEINKLRIAYENSIFISEKEEILKKIIFYYLDIKDFFYTNKFITEYISNQYKGFEIFEKLRSELELLIFEMQDKIKNRKDDISLFFIDSLRAKDVFDDLSGKVNMPYLNKKSKESITFKNAYSTSIFTNESSLSMLRGKMPFEDENYLKQKTKINESYFLEKLDDYRYNFNVFSSSALSFIEDEGVHNEIEKIYISETLWNYFSYIAEKNENKNSFFSLLHLCYEIHPPHLSGYHNKMPIDHEEVFSKTSLNNPTQNEKDFIAQYRECLMYVDRQLEFYMELLPDEALKVIFSDHGQIIEEGALGSVLAWNDLKYHVPLIINSSRFPKMQYDGLFSMIDFGDLILNLIDNKISIKNRNMVQMQLEPIYNGALTTIWINSGYEDCVHGFKVFRTYDYKYVITGDGKEKFYELSNEEKNLIENENYSDVISCFKEKINTSFPEFDDKNVKNLFTFK